MVVKHLFLSRGHAYFGRYGKSPEQIPMEPVGSLECFAGQGIAGDRFFDYKQEYKGQITFISLDALEEIWNVLNVPPEGRDPSAPRRNVVVSGVDLNALVGKTFEVQGVQFTGIEECKPCSWMEAAIAPGAEQLMRRSGGLRAKIETDGVLRVS